MVNFAKGHGTGNDFVILPDPDGMLPLTPRLVAALCDRRRGLGADGVLRVVRSANHPEAAGQPAEWFMDYWNSDGSHSEMCGNGIRVYARYLVDNGLAAPGELTIATRAGVVGAVVDGDEIAARLRLPRVYGESTAPSPVPATSGPASTSATRTWCAASARVRASWASSTCRRPRRSTTRTSRPA